MALTTNQFKNGNHIDVEGTIFKIVEFQHVKPGKGGLLCARSCVVPLTVP